MPRKTRNGITRCVTFRIAHRDFTTLDAYADREGLSSVGALLQEKAQALARRIRREANAASTANQPAPPINLETEDDPKETQDGGQASE